MTFWVTLWYAGAVAMTMGYEGMTLEECEKLKEVILTDITNTYQQSPETVEGSIFPINKFKVTCETEQLPIDEKYAE